MNAALPAAASSARSRSAPTHRYDHRDGLPASAQDIPQRGAVAFRPERRARMLAASRLRCRVERLSELLRRRGHLTRPVAFLKIDVEGAEMDVLEGIDEGDWPRIHAVVVEVHSATLSKKVQAALALRFARVGEAADAELAACGLERAMVFAHGPIHGVHAGVQICVQHSE